MIINPSYIFDVDQSTRMNVISQWYQSLNFRWYDPFSYFSVWTLLIAMTPISNRFFLLLKFNMMLQTSIGGFYISYYYPRQIVIEYLNLILEGKLLYVIDFLSHHLPLLCFFGVYQTYLYPETFCEYVIMNIPLLSYVILFNVEQKYQLTTSDIRNLFPFYMSLVFLPFLMKGTSTSINFFLTF